MTSPLFLRGAHGDFLLRDGIIVAKGPLEAPAGASRLDYGRLLPAPGFIDLQINGAFGHDFTADPESIWAVGEQLPRHGVTAFLPTIISSPPAALRAALQVWREGPPSGYLGAAAVGLHLEGPFLNPAKAGAHDPAFLRSPELSLAAGWAPDTGVRLVTLAPELPGALDLVRGLSRRGVLVAAGHSLASADQARAVFDAGVRFGTHLFNAMPPVVAREPGLAAALLEEGRASIGVIADGIHVDPILLRLAWRLTRPDRVVLVTDAMAGLGMPPGAYHLGGRSVRIEATGARLEDGTLAGSVLSMDQAVRNMVAFSGCEPHAAIEAASRLPARLLGLPSGKLEAGAPADIVLLTPELEVAGTIVGGEIVHDRMQS